MKEDVVVRQCMADIAPLIYIQEVLLESFLPKDVLPTCQTVLAVFA